MRVTPNGFEHRLALLLNRLVEAETLPIRLLFKGTPEQVTKLLDRLVTYLPDALKPRISWDPALDGARLANYPFTIAGFSREPPQGGDPLLIDLKTQNLPEKAEHAVYFQPQTPYQRWLHASLEEATDKARLELAYRLSCTLLENKPLSGVAAELPGFAAANGSLIEERFLGGCERLFGTRLAHHLADAVPLALKLDLFLKAMPLEPLADIIETVILTHRLIRKDGSLPAMLVESGSARLHLLARVWRGETLQPEYLERLELPQRKELLCYLLLTQGTPPWVSELLRADETTFEACLNAPETRPVVANLLLATIGQDRDLQEIARVRLNETLAQNQSLSLLRGEWQPMSIIDAILRKGRWDDKDLKALLAWAKKHKPPERNFPYLRAFLYPTQEIPLPAELMMEPDMAERLAHCLVNYHDYSAQALRQLGFTEQLIEQLQFQSKKGWLDKLTSLFR